MKFLNYKAILIVSSVFILIYLYNRYSFSLKIEGYTSVPSNISYAYRELTPILQQKIGFPTRYNLTVQALFIENYLLPMYNNTPITQNNIKSSKDLIDVLASANLKFNWDTTKNNLYVFMDYILEKNLKIEDLEQIKAILPIITKNGVVDKKSIAKYDKLVTYLREMGFMFKTEIVLAKFIDIASNHGVSLEEVNKLLKMINIIKIFGLNNISEIDTYMKIMHPLKHVDLVPPFYNYLENDADKNILTKLIKNREVLLKYLNSTKREDYYFYILMTHIDDTHYKTLLEEDSLDLNKQSIQDSSNNIISSIQTSLMNKNKELLTNFNTLSKNSIMELKDNAELIILISIFPYTFLAMIHNNVRKWRGEDKKTVCDPQNPLNIRMTNMNAGIMKPSLQEEQHVKYAALCK